MFVDQVSGLEGFAASFGRRLGASASVAAVLVGGLTLTSTSHAAINYGSFAGDTINFVSVAEDNQGLFEAPTVTGDTISFSPLGFEASSSGVSPPDIVDGTLSLVIEGQDNTAITGFELDEAGAFSLAGVGTNATRVVVSVAAAITVLEVDGVAVAGPTFTDGAILADFNLLTDGFNVGTPWSASHLFDIAALAAANGVTGDVTKFRITLDNTLVAMSEAGSSSFIDKKAVNGVTLTIVPEPASLLLAGLSCLLVARRRA